MVLGSNGCSHYRHGDLVEVRPWEQILATLDDDGKLEGIPFMPEMARYCGQRFRVGRRADKTCVEGLGIRRLGNTVFLEGLRCDGSAHDGCQRACLIFWKEVWLRPVSAAETETLVPPHTSEGDSPIFAATMLRTVPELGQSPSYSFADLNLPTRKGDFFLCQSTELLAATTDFPRWSIGHYLQDLASREITLGRLARILWRVAVNKVRRLVGLGPYGHVQGSEQKPPKGELDLQPGQWVEVKSRQEIMATLDPAGKNRGLSFEIEMLEHCGRRYRVAFQVEKIILEEPGQQWTGKMVTLDRTVVLDGVACQGLCSKNCPRANLFYWRESWLRPVEPPK
jgi:hypothetical protein